MFHINICMITAIEPDANKPTTDRAAQDYARCHWCVIVLVYPWTTVPHTRRNIFRDYGLCGGSKVVDYSGDLHSLALEDAYLIWKSHTKTGGWDLSPRLLTELR